MHYALIYQHRLECSNPVLSIHSAMHPPSFDIPANSLVDIRTSDLVFRHGFLPLLPPPAFSSCFRQCCQMCSPGCLAPSMSSHIFLTSLLVFPSSFAHALYLSQIEISHTSNGDIITCGFIPSLRARNQSLICTDFHNSPSIHVAYPHSSSAARRLLFFRQYVSFPMSLCILSATWQIAAPIISTLQSG